MARDVRHPPPGPRTRSTLGTPAHLAAQVMDLLLKSLLVAPDKFHQRPHLLRQAQVLRSKPDHLRVVLQPLVRQL